MTDVVILAGGDPTTVDSTGYFYMDATRVVSPMFSSEISSYPVQRSGDVSDNVVNKNITFSIEGVITNHFLPAEARIGSPEESKDLIGFTTNRVSKAISLLQDYWLNKKYITLVLEHLVAENCILKDFTFDITAQSADALDVRMTFEQVRTTTVERIVTYDVIPEKKAEAVESKGGGTASKTDLESRKADWQKRVEQYKLDLGRDHINKSVVNPER